MSKQVLDREQMQHLQELGLDTSKAIMCYRRRTRDFRGEEKVGRWSLAINQPIIVSNFETYDEVPAFTLQDILDLLPSEIQKDGNWSTLDILKHPQNYIMCFWNGEPLFRCENSILIDAAYSMLCWCIENGYVKTNKED